MGLTCHHGQGIRYIDLYEGERYTYAHRLLRRIKTSNPMFSNFILMYDIGCRFDPYLKRTDPDLWNETTIIVNAMHVYGHPLSCQVTRGPKRTSGVGESNGEDPERDWSSKRHLVAAGKVSSASRRRQVLDAHSRQRNITLRDALPCFLSKRLTKARKHIAEANEQLQLIFATCLKITDRQGSEVFIDWSMDFVDSQIHLQQRFFQDSPIKRKVNAQRNAKIFSALKKERSKERSVEESIHRGYEAARTTSETLPLKHLREFESLQHKLQLCVTETDRLLKEADQTRADWAESGTLWQSHCQSSSPEMEVFRAIEEWRRCSEAVQEKHAKWVSAGLGLRLQDPEAAHSKELWMLCQKQEVALAKAAEILQKHGLPWSAHEPGSENWRLLKTQQVREQLEETLDKLMAQVAQRTSELKSLHTQVSGQAEANPMTQRLIQRYPKIQQLVAEFNQLAKGLPEPFTIEPISAASLVPPSQARSCDEVEAEQDALWALEFLRIQSSIGLMAKNLDDRNIWSESKLVRGAIDHRLRFLRATEEVGLVIREADRLWRWTTARATAFNDFISDFRCTNEIPRHAKEFAWEVVLLLDNWLEAHGGIFGFEQ